MTNISLDNLNIDELNLPTQPNRNPISTEENQEKARIARIARLEREKRENLFKISLVFLGVSLILGIMALAIPSIIIYGDFYNVISASKKLTSIDTFWGTLILVDSIATFIAEIIFVVIIANSYKNAPINKTISKLRNLFALSGGRYFVYFMWALKTSSAFGSGSMLPTPYLIFIGYIILTATCTVKMKKI